MSNFSSKQLLQKALEARRNAYAPYSDYLVGACLLGKDGQLFTGCNIENAAFGPSVCAERCAIFKAVSEGCRNFTAIAIVGGPKDTPEEDLAPAYPCGVCRQVIAEFCEPDFQIYCGTPEHPERYTLGELLPKSFGL